MTCSQCQTEIVDLPHYELKYNDVSWHFCSRICLVDFIAPELKKACVPKQWLPNEEEIRRMSE
jgi:hypothetical protein